MKKIILFFIFTLSFVSFTTNTLAAEFYTDITTTETNPNSVTLSWFSQMPAEATYVEYGIDISYGQRILATRGDHQNLREQMATLTDLKINTRYHYRLTDSNGTNLSADQEFVTPTITFDVIYLTASRATATIRWESNFGGEQYVYYGSTTILPGATPDLPAVTPRISFKSL